MSDALLLAAPSQARRKASRVAPAAQRAMTRLGDLLPRARISAEQRHCERSMMLGLVLDLGIVVPMAGAAIWANSLTLLGECLRAGLMIALEVFLLAVLRRIHRRQLVGYDYGTGKLKEFGNLLVGSAMLLGAAWIGATAGFRAGAIRPCSRLSGWPRRPPSRSPMSR